MFKDLKGHTIEVLLGESVMFILAKNIIRHASTRQNDEIYISMLLAIVS